MFTTTTTTSLISFALLFAAVLPSALAVIFAKGRENRFDNSYLDTTDSNFQLDCIKWHNYFRKLHGAPALRYSASLAEYARRRAIQLATKDGTNFYHPDDLPYGENLAWNSQEPIDCGLPLKLWYDEWKIYNFQRPNINAANGHFTQMIWKDSANIGCGQAISKGPKGGTFTVCNYDPPGNYENEELDNVFPAVGGNYYDFKQESRYKSKKLKIQYTHDGHTSSTHTFENGRYNSGGAGNAFSWSSNLQNHGTSTSNQQNTISNSYSSNNNYAYNYGGSQNSGYQSPSVSTGNSFSNKWSSFRPSSNTGGSTWSTTWSKPATSWSSTWNSNYNYGSSKPSYSYSTSPKSTSSSNSYSSFRPNFKMSFGGNSLW